MKEEPPRPVVRLLATTAPSAAAPAPRPQRRLPGTAVVGLALLAAVAATAVGVRAAQPAPRPAPAAAPRLFVPSCDPSAVVQVRADGTPSVRPRAGCLDGLLLDAAGLSEVVDPSGDRLRRVRADGRVTRASGQVVDARSALGLRDLLRSPSAVGVDRAGHVYVGDRPSPRVLQWAGGRLRPLPDASRRAGAGPGLFAVGDDLSATWADSGAASVYRDDARGVRVRVAGTGVRGGDGDFGPAVRAQLDAPRAVAVDRAGRLYLSEGVGRVRRVEADGTVVPVAGSPSAEPGLRTPGDLALDPQGGLYVVDLGAHAVLRLAPDGTVTRITSAAAPPSPRAASAPAARRR